MHLAIGDAVPLRPDARNDWLALSLIVLGFGLLAVAVGQTNTWDLRNYHLYSGWAFWTGRGARDFAAAQAQTYFNPVMATATYLLLVHTPPQLGAFLLGLVQGANVVPVYLLARRLLPADLQDRNRWLPVLVALVGMTGATAVAELGGSMGDNLVSLPVLCAYAIVFGAASLGARKMLSAALLIGCAVGLKLTVAPFALGLVLTAPFLGPRGAARWRLLLLGGAACLLGFLAVDGFWLHRLQAEFGNPFYPQFATVFQGAYAPPVSLRDTRFLPRSLFEWLFYPLVWVVSPHRVSDAWFFDLRVPLAFLAMPILMRRHATERSGRVRMFCVALAIAYVAWLPLFGVYRYLLPIEMLAPLIVVLALATLAPDRAIRFASIALAIIAVLVRPPGWGHLHEYGTSFLQTEIPALPALDSATIVLAEDEPLAFLALGFPPTTAFVRIGGNLLGPPFPAYAMDRAAAQRLAAARGPLYALLACPQCSATRAVLERQHLELGPACAPVRSNLLVGRHRAVLCPLQRLPRPESRDASVHSPTTDR